MSREYLNIEQKEALAKLHPDANKTSFIDRISKVVVSKNTDWKLVRKFHDYGVEATVMVKGK